MNVELDGLSLIGSTRGRRGGAAFHGLDPVTGAPLQPAYHSAQPDEIERAVALAQTAAPALARMPGLDRATLLRAIAAEMEAAREDFAWLLPRETALPAARANGELTRTVQQLQSFAALVEDGSWVDARVDHADARRQPLPKPDVRSMRRALGPVVVFGASNFPLAFSVAGGDTASALAAGCPVIVKAHPGHPATSERAGLAIAAALARVDAPEGTFSLLFDAGIDVGRALASHADVRAVAFTGSRGGGRALMDLVAARARPIPVFAEMGSVNPVFVLHHALAMRGAALAATLHASVMLGVGQFCTRPGLVVLPQGAAGDAFASILADLFAHSAGTPMLHPAIAARYDAAAAAMAARDGVRILRKGTAAPTPQLLQTDAERFLADHALHEEVFGPGCLLVRTRDTAQMFDVARAFEGQLTATVLADGADHAIAAALLPELVARAGRVLMNGMPTGVEVCAAIVHGGPYPATSDGASTSVGSAAIERFTRRVCWQNVPDALLPEALREDNPLGLVRLVDGRRG